MNNSQDIKIDTNNKEIELPNNNPAPTSNKFFNFLEDEAVNINTAINNDTKPVVQPSSIEVLDDFSTPKEEDTIMPFFFDKQDNNKNVNQIEEIKNDPEEEIVDPMDSVIKLDPNYSSIVKEEKGLDLKTAIGEIRNLVSSLEERGFKISLDELDLAGNYQMTINIKNND